MPSKKRKRKRPLPTLRRLTPTPSALPSAAKKKKNARRRTTDRRQRPPACPKTSSPVRGNRKNTGASACPARGSRRRRPRLAFPRTNRTTAGKARPLTEQTIAPLLQKADPLLQKTGAFLQRLEDAFREQGPNLKINGLIWNYADKDGTPSIRLRGEVANPSEWLLNIPTMKIRLLDREGNLLRETDMAPERSMIAPGTNVKFEIDIDAPPQNVKQVLAYFEK